MNSISNTLASVAIKPAAPSNPNFCATVVTLRDFVDLPNCDNVKAALIFGNSVIVGKDTPDGATGLFFPVEVALSREFLAANNLYRKPEWGNADPEKKGFFEEHGRVKAVRFRGHKSEGFWMPVSSLDFIGQRIQLEPGTSFDTINGVEICRKYVPAGTRTAGAGKVDKQRSPSLDESIVEGQFRLHFDTENLRRNLDKIRPDDLISITEKWHGTSVVIAKVLVKSSLSFAQRLLTRCGLPLQTNRYGLVYSSRRVIKAVNGVRKAQEHFYSSDIWGDVAREAADRVPDGFTLYGEIVGYTSDGAPIQKGYAYGCEPGKHRLLIYRVTMTNPAGKVFELGYRQMEEFCAKYGFETPPCLYFGMAGDLLGRLGTPLPCSEGMEWTKAFAAAIERNYAADRDCPHNPPGTAAEGIVLRVDRLEQVNNYKLKTFRFLERETKALDTGEVDTETAQGEAA